MAPWQGPRHRSWASDTNWSLLFAFAVVAGYIAWELVGTAPQGMVTLVGVAGGAVFGAVSGDKKKRDSDVEHRAERAEATADRAEAKADTLAEVVEAAHPDETHSRGLPDPGKGTK